MAAKRSIRQRLKDKVINVGKSLVGISDDDSPAPKGKPKTRKRNTPFSLGGTVKTVRNRKKDLDISRFMK